MHTLLQDASFDVLLLLDCCFAARALKKGSGKTMEVLCASSREVEAAIDGTGTGSLFTSALIAHLKSCSSRPEGLLVSELANLLHLDHTLEEQSPNHVTISGHGRPIILRSLNQGQATSPVAVLPGQLSMPDDLFNFEEALHELVTRLEITTHSGLVAFPRCLIDTRSLVSFISIKYFKDLSLKLHDGSYPGYPLITKQVAGANGSTWVHFNTGKGGHVPVQAFIWEGASVPATGEIDMILGYTALMHQLPIKDYPPPRSPRLDYEIERWHHERIFGRDQPYQNENPVDQGRSLSRLCQEHADLAIQSETSRPLRAFWRSFTTSSRAGNEESSDDTV